MNHHVLPALEAAASGRVTVLDLEETVCPGREFSQSLWGLDNFRREDGVHFSEPGKLRVGSWLGEELLRAPVQSRP